MTPGCNDEQSGFHPARSSWVVFSGLVQFIGHKRYPVLSASSGVRPRMSVEPRQIIVTSYLGRDLGGTSEALRAGDISSFFIPKTLLSMFQCLYALYRLRTCPLRPCLQSFPPRPFFLTLACMRRLECHACSTLLHRFEMPGPSASGRTQVLAPKTACLLVRCSRSSDSDFGKIRCGRGPGDSVTASRRS